ncbi:B12-binding domain-containing radical SAM protein [bacterium]|nr:B12-binding domain-containing radical SAM protein [bacterium]MBU1917158.1 B12-binding domain-containing radical SAM protein [bacterium]
MLNILLVNSPATPRVVTSKIGNMYPYSLLFLASYLRTTGDFQADILDLTVSKDNFEVLKTMCSQKKFDVIGFTGTTENRFLILELIQVAKKELPGSKIVLGGNHFSFTAEEVMRACILVDDVVRGDGEVTFHELLKHYAGRGSGKENIDGLSYRFQGEIIHNPDRNPDKCLDCLNIRDDALNDLHLPGGSYSPFMNMRNFDDKNKPVISIHAGRGCPASCVFCVYNRKKYRTRSVESVITEIKDKKRTLSCHSFHFNDPHLLKRKRFVEELCHKLIEEKIDIEWYAETRADIDLSLLVLMKKAGLVSVDLGLETASEKVLKAIKKNISPQQVSTMLKKCYELGLRTKVFTMVSLPDETPEDAQMTIKFLQEHRRMITTIGMATARIYPGTTMEQMAKERGLLPKSFDWYDKSFFAEDPNGGKSIVPFWFEHLSPEYIRKHHRQVIDIQRSLQTFSCFHRYLVKRYAVLLFDWSQSGLEYKKRVSVYFIRWLVVKMKILFGWY